MPLTDAFNLGDDHLTRWLIENSPIKIPFYQAWVWQSVSGNPLEYARTGLLAQAQVKTDCSVVIEQSDRAMQQAFSLVEYATRYSVCSVDLDTYQVPNQLDAVSFALAKRRLLYAYASWITGAANPGSLVSICDPARRIDRGGASFSLNCLDDAYERVVAGTGRPTLIMSHSRSLRTYRSVCRESGFKPERAPWRWYDPGKGRMIDGSVDAFNGTPWLANDLINPDNDPGEERTFMMVAGDDSGAGPTRGVTGFIPSAQGRNMFNKRTVQGIWDSVANDMKPGIDVWVTMPAGLGLGSQGALSIIENYTTVADCGEGAEG